MSANEGASPRHAGHMSACDAWEERGGEETLFDILPMEAGGKRYLNEQNVWDSWRKRIKTY